MKPSKKTGVKGRRQTALLKHNPKSEAKKQVPIVGIGASAGGLEAFRALLEALPPKTGIAYVLVQHLDPYHESALTELLARVTHIPVVEVKQRTRIESDHVYVISPNKNMALDGTHLTLSPRSKVQGVLNMPIDYFFQSLATARAGRAIGVVLSGTGSDGTAGLRTIKEAGGFTLVQDETAKYQGMPSSAISARVVDYVLPPDRIAEEIVALTKSSLQGLQGEIAKEAGSGSNEYQTIIKELLRMTHTDFSHYKATTLTRRIARRMLVNKTPTQRAYLEVLRGNFKEADALFNDILINVTSFFRDPAALHSLAHKIFPRLLTEHSGKGTLRIWVAGCSTGEEVYSLAITFLELRDNKRLAVQLQIFGTDLSPSAVDKARRGVYTKSDMSGVSPSRMERFFEHTHDGSYQIRKEVRDMCVFSVHNLLKDLPFSRMNIVSFCNVLIYMDTALQSKIFSTLHYALLPSGTLVLGKSETVEPSRGLFVQIEKKSKVFMKTAGKRDPPSVISRPVPTESIGRSSAKAGASVVVPAEAILSIQDEADAVLIQNFVPASILINANCEIIQLRGSTEEYLKLPSGKATLNLLKIVKAELVFELRDAIHRAKKSGLLVKKEVTQLSRDPAHLVCIEVLPLKSSSEIYFLVVLRSVSENKGSMLTTAGKLGLNSQSMVANNRRFARLEKELIQAHDNARSYAEEQEAATEELQSANEEVLSSNEELQSINEELETSTEELESTNEELNTINQELQTRNSEVTDARDYAESIIATMQSPLLVLDKELRVKTANQAFYKLFRTTKEVVGGHFLAELGNGQWDVPELRVLLHEILPKNKVVYDYEIAHTFPAIGYRVFNLNAHTLDQKGEGKMILLAFEDVTEEQEIKRQKDEFIGIASHEIRTPVTTIKMFIELLEKKLSGSAKKEYGEILEHIATQSDRLTTLVGDLLSLSQMQAGNFLLNKEEFDLDKLIKSTVSGMQEITSRHTITKEGTLKRLVDADSHRIEQVLINLLTNAVKYSPNGKKVILRVETKAEDAVVSVQDFGVGIPKEEHETIFDRFYRARSKDGSPKSERAEGFGLGLYIAAQIVEKHGGKIWVESAEGKGSIFFFTLALQTKGSRAIV